MSVRDAALFDRQREIKNAPLNEGEAIGFIQGKIMIFGDIMIIARIMVHKINAESRSFPRDTDGQLEDFENTFQSILKHLTQPCDVLVNAEFWRRQLLQGRDCRSGGKRMGVESARNQN